MAIRECPKCHSDITSELHKRTCMELPPPSSVVLKQRNQLPDNKPVSGRSAQVKTIMAFGEPTFENPKGGVNVRNANEIEVRLLECEQGQWLPVTFNSMSQANATTKILQERGYECVRNRSVKGLVNVRAGIRSKQHAHIWSLPAGADNAHEVVQRCRSCGETRQTEPAQEAAQA